MSESGDRAEGERRGKWLLQLHNGATYQGERLLVYEGRLALMMDEVALLSRWLGCAVSVEEIR